MPQKSEKIRALLKKHEILMVAHFYQKDEIVALADFCGDSLQLAQKASADPKNTVLFCGVGFMGESVKILAPQKLVIMPKIACCSMARMISSDYFDRSIEILKNLGISDVFPMTYINSSAEVKAKVGRLGGVICTSSNASKIFSYAISSGKKIFFLPDRCLGLNLAKNFGLKSAVLGVDPEDSVRAADVICYNGFCSVHQLFTPQDVEFFRENYPEIRIAVHPECDPRVVEMADFSGSTSQLISYVQNLPNDVPVAVGTEANLVNRMRRNGLANTFVLSSTIPECPTMNETTVDDVLRLLTALDSGRVANEITLDPKIAHDANLALQKMLSLS